MHVKLRSRSAENGIEHMAQPHAQYVSQGVKKRKMLLR